MMERRYDIIRSLGQGGMAEVFLARDRERGIDVAIKRPLASLRADPEVRERFAREAAIGRLLQHPNIVALYDAGDDDGAPYLVLEYVQGGTLRDLLKDGAPVPVDTALGIVRAVLAALGHAHGCDIVHGDLKPSNVLLGADGQVKLADFGIASVLHGPAPSSTPWGTPPYVAPEVLRGEPASPRSDLYALGVILYRLLTGVQPQTTGQTDDSIPPPSALRAGIPRALDEVVLQLLQSDPARRPDSAYTVLKLLDASPSETTARLASEGPTAPLLAATPERGPAPAPPDVRSRPARRLGGRHVALLLAALAAVALGAPTIATPPQQTAHGEGAPIISPPPADPSPVPTRTPLPATPTPLPPTATAVPATATPTPTPTATIVPRDDEEDDDDRAVSSEDDRKGDREKRPSRKRPGRGHQALDLDLDRIVDGVLR